MLKGLTAQETKETPPFIHDLGRLASLANVTLTSEQQEELNIITGFNAAGRYADTKYQLSHGRDNVIV
jgi:HEPN domain-containing protein